MKLRIQNRFGITPNLLLNDSSISLKAKGLYWYIQSKPDDWDFSGLRIAKDHKDWKDWIFSALRELEDTWYLIRTKTKNNKWNWEVEYTLLDSPVSRTENPPRVPRAENPEAENPEAENPPTNKERNTNKEIQIKNPLSIPETSFSYQLSNFFFDMKMNSGKRPAQLLYQLKKKSREEIIQNWSQVCEKILNLDKIPEIDLKKIIVFALKDPFWSQNILSIEKLRKKNRDWIPYAFVLLDRTNELQNKNIPIVL